MSTKINIHNIVEVREQITHYTNNHKFICRTITAVDSDGNEVEVCLFTHENEQTLLPLTTKRDYYNA
jgi:hypothetical protein